MIKEQALKLALFFLAAICFWIVAFELKKERNNDNSK